MRLVMLALLAGFSLSSSAEQMIFQRFGKDVATLSLEELKTKVGVTEITVNEKHEGKEVTYLAFSFTKLLEVVYGPKWHTTADEALFTCIDGYKPSVPLPKIQHNPSYLAFAKKDGSPFQHIDRKKNEPINYGPFYLVWENLKNPEMRIEGMEFWPYQVASVNLILFRDQFPDIAPPGKISDSVKRGFTYYRSQCLQCHTINGQGGARGVELNYPVNVTEYLSEAWLTKWISDPTSVRAGTVMPAVNVEYPNRNSMIKDIIAYLRVMKKHKKATSVGK